jgi:hypothetical protein
MQKFLKVSRLLAKHGIDDAKRIPCSLESVGCMIEMYLGVPKHLYTEDLFCIVEMESYYNTVDCRRYYNILDGNVLLLSNFEIRLSFTGQTVGFTMFRLHDDDWSQSSYIHEHTATETRKRKYAQTIAMQKASSKQFLKVSTNTNTNTNAKLPFFYVLKITELFLGAVCSCREEDNVFFICLYFYETIETKEYLKKLEESPLLFHDLEFRTFVI